MNPRAIEHRNENLRLCRNVFVIAARKVRLDVAKLQMRANRIAHNAKHHFEMLSFGRFERCLDIFCPQFRPKKSISEFDGLSGIRST